MRKIISDLVIFLMLFFLCALFARPAFSRTVTCDANNGETHKIEIENGSRGIFIEVVKFHTGERAGQVQKIFIRDVESFDHVEDYIQFKHDRYVLTYSLRCYDE